MKFTIETKVLEAGLRIASVAMSSGKQTLPILGNILIEATKDQIILSTTNLEIYVRQKLPAVVKKEGAITAPFSILSQLVSRMQATTIAITLNGTELEFRSGEVVASLETLAASEFPPAVKTQGDGVECEAADILKPFSMLQHAIGVEASRYVLMGINVVAGLFKASDGHRIALFQGKEISETSIIIPDIFIRAVLKIEPAGTIKVFVDDNGYIILVSQEIEIAAKLIEGTYPSLNWTVPYSTDKALSCGRKPLINALQTCAIFVKPAAPGLFIEGRDKEVEVSQPGKAQVMVLGTELVKQPAVKMRINEAFLIAVLNVLESDDVRIQVKDSKSPILIEEGKFKEVIMQMTYE